MTTVKKSGGGRTTKKKPAVSAEEATMAMVMEMKRPARQEVRICLDSAVSEKRDKANQALGEAQSRAARWPQNESVKSAVADAEAEAEAASEAAEAVTVTFVFEALGRDRIETMMKAHQPTAGQKDEYRKMMLEEGKSPTSSPLIYNPDTFPPVLMSESCSQPSMTLDEANELWGSEVWSRGELGRLFLAAWTVNEIVV